MKDETLTRIVLEEIFGGGDRVDDNKSNNQEGYGRPPHLGREVDMVVRG